MAISKDFISKAQLGVKSLHSPPHPSGSKERETGRGARECSNRGERTSRRLLQKTLEIWAACTKVDSLAELEPESDTAESSKMYRNMRGEGRMNELTSPAFALACGGVRCVPRAFLDVEEWHSDTRPLAYKC